VSSKRILTKYTNSTVDDEVVSTLGVGDTSKKRRRWSERAGRMLSHCLGRRIDRIKRERERRGVDLAGRYISDQKRGSAPLFPQKGGNGPLFAEGKKGGGKGGSIQKRGGRYLRNTKNPANLIPAKYQYQKNCW